MTALPCTSLALPFWSLLKSFHQTTFKLTGLSVSSGASGDSTITRKNSDGQIRIKCKSPVGKSDHALDELRRVEKDLEINLKITETLSKLNSANKEESSHSNKRTYVKRQQELLYRKYLKKLQVRNRIPPTKPILFTSNSVTILLPKNFCAGMTAIRPITPNWIGNNFYKINYSNIWIFKHFSRKFQL